MSHPQNIPASDPTCKTTIGAFGPYGTVVYFPRRTRQRAHRIAVLRTVSELHSFPIELLMMTLDYLPRVLPIVPRLISQFRDRILVYNVVTQCQSCGGRAVSINTHGGDTFRCTQCGILNNTCRLFNHRLFLSCNSICGPLLYVMQALLYHLYEYGMCRKASANMHRLCAQRKNTVPSSSPYSSCSWNARVMLCLPGCAVLSRWM